MKLIYFTVCLLVLLVGLSVSAKAQAKVGNLKNSSVISGCSCALQFPGAGDDKFVFLYDLTRDAYMNIDGKDTKLRVVRSTENTKRRPRVGDRFYQEYTATGVKVRLDYVTTRVCKPGDEECESFDYNVTITVTKGGKKKSVKTDGSCGC